MAERNPYKPGEPEWQLHENMMSCLSSANAFAEDARRYQEKSQSARECANRYRIALEKLKGK